MKLEEAVQMARQRARHLRVDPQVTITEVYEAELLRRLQGRLRGRLVWKGGTVLRLEGSERFSRDLDATRASRSVTVKELTRVLREAGEDLAYVTEVDIKKQPNSVVGLFRFDVTDLAQPLRVSVEVSLRERILLPPGTASTARISHPSGLPPVVVARLDIRELLAEKTRALVVRLASRDIYDVYWLLQRGVTFEPTLFLQKMRYYQKVGAALEPATALRRAIHRLQSYDPSRAKADLANLLPIAQRNLDFGVIVADVLRALRFWEAEMSARKPRSRNRVSPGTS